MRVVLVAVALLAVIEAPAVVCRVGTSTTWTGSLSELAAIEAKYQAEQAQAAGRAFPNGAPTASPWSGLVNCSEAGVS